MEKLIKPMHPAEQIDLAMEGMQRVDSFIGGIAALLLVMREKNEGKVITIYLN